MRMDPAIERIREVLDYDPATGICAYRSGKGRGGARTKDGYIQVFIDRRPYMAHRVAWLLSTGSWPSEQIDHRNGIRNDNRLCNLREATNAENCQNKAGRRGTASRFIGVVWHKRDNRWLAQIRVDGKVRHLGSYLSEEAAAEAYAKAKSELHTFQPSLRNMG